MLLQIIILSELDQILLQDILMEELMRLEYGTLQDRKMRLL